MPPKILGVIPARYASSRFPGKALARLDSRTMLEHVYERVSMARYLSTVVIATDDERIRTALEIAEKEGLDYRFEKTTLVGEELHPNTVRLTVERGPHSHVMIGSSLGAGRILVTEIDGYPVEVHGNCHTIVLLAEDVKGSIARIAAILADDNCNIATLRLTRKERGGDAFMVIEVDEQPGENVRDDIRKLTWVRWTHRLDKVSA